MELKEVNNFLQTIVLLINEYNYPLESIDLKFETDRPSRVSLVVFLDKSFKNFSVYIDIDAHSEIHPIDVFNKIKIEYKHRGFEPKKKIIKNMEDTRLIELKKKD